jgi:phage gpG-like protein
MPADTVLTYEWFPRPIVVANEYSMMAAKFESRAGLMEALSQIVVKDIGYQFDVEGVPKWAAWSEAYADSSEHGGAILDRLGDLRAGAENEGSLEVTRDTIAWTGAAAPEYWIYHALGTIKMPQRTWIGLTPTGEAEAYAAADEWLGAVVAGGSAGLTFG